MTMTGKDFDAIAEAVAEAKRDVQYYLGEPDLSVALDALQTVTRELSTACARRYKGGYGFNRQNFVTACGFEDS